MEIQGVVATVTSVLSICLGVWVNVLSRAIRERDKERKDERTLDRNDMLQIRKDLSTNYHTKDAVKEMMARIQADVDRLHETTDQQGRELARLDARRG